MAEVSSADAKSRVPTRPRRMRVENPREHQIGLRCNDEEYAAINAKASESGLTVGAYLRTLAVGSPGPRAVRRPPVERKELARLLGHLGKVGSNINQLARAFNAAGRFPGFPELIAIREEVKQMRAALLKALGRGD